MGMLDAAAGRVAAGATVELRPSGSSMVPLIRSRQRVIVAPVDPAKLEVGDIVLARVAGTVYLYLVSAVDHLAAGLTNASARLDYVHLNGVDHFLKEDITKDRRHSTSRSRSLPSCAPRSRHSWPATSDTPWGPDRGPVTQRVIRPAGL